MDIKDLKLKSSISLAKGEGDESGKPKKRTFNAIAHTGHPIPWHNGWKNLVIDLETLTFKETVPVFWNHNPEIVIGMAKLKIEDGVLLAEGTFFDSSEKAQEIVAMGDEGMPWEMSIGVESFRHEFFENAENHPINNKELSGDLNIMYDSRVLEITITAVGADDKTKVDIFNKKGADMDTIKVDAKLFEKLACACGKKKDASLQEITDAVVEKDADLAEAKEEIEELKEEVTEIAEKLKEAEAKIEAVEEEERIEEIQEAVNTKGFEMSKDEIIAMAKSKSETKAFLSMAAKLKAKEPEKKKIDEKFTKKVVTSTRSNTGDISDVKKSELRRAKAREMVKNGEAISFADAIAQMPDSDFE